MKALDLDLDRRHIGQERATRKRHSQLDMRAAHGDMTRRPAEPIPIPISRSMRRIGAEQTDFSPSSEAKRGNKYCLSAPLWKSTHTPWLGTAAKFPFPPVYCLANQASTSNDAISIRVRARSRARTCHGEPLANRQGVRLLQRRRLLRRRRVLAERRILLFLSLLGERRILCAFSSPSQRATDQTCSTRRPSASTCKS